MDHIMGRTECSAKNQNFVFNGLIYTYKHNMSPFSIHCMTPVSCLRCSTSVLIIICLFGCSISKNWIHWQQNNRNTSDWCKYIVAWKFIRSVLSSLRTNSLPFDLEGIGLLRLLCTYCIMAWRANIRYLPVICALLDINVFEATELSLNDRLQRITTFFLHFLVNLMLAK